MSNTLDATNQKGTETTFKTVLSFNLHEGHVILICLVTTSCCLIVCIILVICCIRKKAQMKRDFEKSRPLMHGKNIIDPKNYTNEKSKSRKSTAPFADRPESSGFIVPKLSVYKYSNDLVQPSPSSNIKTPSKYKNYEPKKFFTTSSSKNQSNSNFGPKLSIEMVHPRLDIGPKAKSNISNGTNSRLNEDEKLSEARSTPGNNSNNCKNKYLPPPPPKKNSTGTQDETIDGISIIGSVFSENLYVNNFKKESDTHRKGEASVFENISSRHQSKLNHDHNPSMSHQEGFQKRKWDYKVSSNIPKNNLNIQTTDNTTNKLTSKTDEIIENENNNNDDDVVLDESFVNTLKLTKKPKRSINDVLTVQKSIDLYIKQKNMLNK